MSDISKILLWWVGIGIFLALNFLHDSFKKKGHYGGAEAYMQALHDSGWWLMRQSSRRCPRLSFCLLTSFCMLLCVVAAPVCLVKLVLDISKLPAGTYSG
jgi:hypothetical protein